MYKATLTTYEAARAQLKSEESQLPFGANAIQIYDSYIRLLLKQGRTDDALAAADQSRARALEQNLERSGRQKPPTPHCAQPTQHRPGHQLHSAFLLAGQRPIVPLGHYARQNRAVSPARRAADRCSRRTLSSGAARHARPHQTPATPTAKSLYQMLVAPAARLIRPNTPVIILADGILSQLNFETLLVPGPSPEFKRQPPANFQSACQPSFPARRSHPFVRSIS